jgi:hypothetical protein
VTARAALTRVLSVLGSYGLAVTIFLLLFVLTLFGTLEQRTRSIHDVQHEYFESAFLVSDVFGIPVPLPGAYLLLSVLFVNLVVGGIVRIRKRASTAGVIVAHVGVLVLLASGFVEHAVSTKGNLPLGEGETGDSYVSPSEWEVAILEWEGSETEEPKLAREWVIPDEDFADLDLGEWRTFRADGLPFAVRLGSYVGNASAAPEGSDVVLKAVARDKEVANNRPAVRLAVATPDGAEGLLWAHQRHALAFEVEDRRFDAEIRRRRWAIPFQLRLDRFVKAEHPGVSTPAEFSSYVTKIEHGVREDVHITMNEPLRHRGYTFYQSSYQTDPDGTQVSVLAVVRNPADRGPLIAWIIIAAGLLWHFGQRLIRTIARQIESLA